MDCATHTVRSPLFLWRRPTSSRQLRSREQTRSRHYEISERSWPRCTRSDEARSLSPLAAEFSHLNGTLLPGASLHALQSALSSSQFGVSLFGVQGELS